MPLRMTEKQYAELLAYQQQQKNGEPAEPVDPPKGAEEPVGPVIKTDLGQEWVSNKQWVTALVILHVPGVAPVVIIVSLFLLFAVLSPLGVIGKQGTYLINKTTDWCDLFVRIGIAAGPWWSLAFWTIVIAAFIAYYRHWLRSRY